MMLSRPRTVMHDGARAGGAVGWLGPRPFRPGHFGHPVTPVSVYFGTQCTQSRVWVPVGFGLVAAESGLGTFKSILFPLPSSPAASPVALAATGGLAGMTSKLATAGDAKSGHAGPAKTPEVASLALPRPGCIGWVVV